MIGLLFASLISGHVVGQTPEKKPHFDLAKIKLAGQTIKVRIADTDERRQYGLMFEKNLPENEGMLFVFPNPQMLGFWMKNTLIPLSIGYFDREAKLIESMEMPVLESEIVSYIPSYRSSKPALCALEMSKGWYKKHNVNKGAVLEVPKNIRCK